MLREPTQPRSVHALSRVAFAEHLLRAGQVLGAEVTEVREGGPWPTGATDKSTHNCQVARHLPVEVCARHHISRGQSGTFKGKQKEASRRM